MKITDINKQKNNNQRYNIYIENSFDFSASDEDIIKYNIKIDNEYDEEELYELIKKCEFTKAYGYALRILDIRDLSIYDLKNKLKKKNYSNNTIDAVIEKLKNYNLMDDNRYAKRYANDALKFKKDGINKIKNSLKFHGINNDIVNTIEIDSIEQYENAYKIAFKKYNLINDKDKNKAKEKLYRYLLSKGYAYDIIKKVINEVIKDLDDDNID